MNTFLNEGIPENNNKIHDSAAFQEAYQMSVTYTERDA